MQITFDKKNYRKHSEQNKKRIRKSLTECGAGRSVLVDKDGCLIAGNGVYEQAEKIGIKTRVVETQKSKGGMTGAYVDGGTYVKSFYSVIGMPSAVKVSVMGNKNMRLHHLVDWRHCVPMIMREEYKK